MLASATEGESVAVYQDKARERITSGTRRIKNICEKALAAKTNEADTRTIVQSVLVDLLGWCQFENLTGEYRIKGNYADFVLKTDSQLLAVIEVKAAGTKLGPKHLYQAAAYAANEGLDWVILTDGVVWQLYRVLFDKPITQDLVFEVSFCDPDVKPKDRTELLYLLSIEAQRKKELDAYYEKKVALCGSNIARVLLGEPMLTKLRSEMRAQTGHRVPLDELATLLVEEVIRPEVQNDETARLIRKAAALARQG